MNRDVCAKLRADSLSFGLIVFFGNSLRRHDVAFLISLLTPSSDAVNPN